MLTLQYNRLRQLIADIQNHGFWVVAAEPSCGEWLHFARSLSRDQLKLFLK